MRLLVKAAMVPLWSSGFIVGTLAIEHTPSPRRCRPPARLTSAP
jgi:hypothetical protein